MYHNSGDISNSLKILINNVTEIDNNNIFINKVNPNVDNTHAVIIPMQNDKNGNKASMNTEIWKYIIILIISKEVVLRKINPVNCVKEEALDLFYKLNKIKNRKIQIYEENTNYKKGFGFIKYDFTNFDKDDNLIINCIINS